LNQIYLAKPNISSSLEKFGNKFFETKKNSRTSFEEIFFWNKIMNTKVWKQISREKFNK